MRILDRAKIPYKTLEYPYDENDLSGLHVAEILGLDRNAVYKTLVAKGDKTGILIFCIPVHQELNLKKAAAQTGNKRVEMVPVKDLQGLTGYIRGGCSPIGMKKKYPVYIAFPALSLPELSVSAGIRGCQMLLTPQALLAVTEGKPADLTD